jgi:hypothetical protein
VRINFEKLEEKFEEDGIYIPDPLLDFINRLLGVKLFVAFHRPLMKKTLSFYPTRMLQDALDAIEEAMQAEDIEEATKKQLLFLQTAGGYMRGVIREIIAERRALD